jgi:hypothetical protein
MKFIALFKKEFRECLPWMCVAFVVFAGIGTLLLREAVLRERSYPIWRDSQAVPWYPSPIHELGPLLLLTAMGLGLAMGIRQFYVPAFDKTWAFTLHRPVRVTVTMCARFAAAILGLLVFLGLPWMAMYVYAAAPGRFTIPVLPRIFWEGWLMVGLGFVAYLGAAVTSLSQARWYTSKAFGAVFAAGLVLLAMAEAPYPAPLVFMGIGLVFLSVQVYALVQAKEF